MSTKNKKQKGEFVPLSEVATYAWDNNTMIKDTSGNKKKFADVLRVDPSYKVLVDSDTGELITEEYLLSDDHKPSQDVLENQISNTTRSNRGLDVYQGQVKEREAFKQALNQAGVFSDLRTKNYQNALRRNPNFGDDWNMFNNIMEFTNIATGGAANRLSLTQNARLLYDIGDAILGNGSWDNVGNSILGNNGIVSDKFAAEHPYWSMVINGGVDIPGGIATYKTYNTLRNPRSAYNIRKGMSLKRGKDLDYALRDLHDYNVRKQMEGIDAPNGRKPYINSSGIPMKEPPTLKFSQLSKDNIRQSLKSGIKEVKDYLKFNARSKVEIEQELNDIAEDFYKSNIKPKLRAVTGHPVNINLFDDDILYDYPLISLDTAYPAHHINKPIKYSKRFNGIIAGNHYVDEGYNNVYGLTLSPDRAKSVAIHEAASHGTDNIMPLYIENFYDKALDTFDSNNFKFEGSGDGYELRATKQQIEYYLKNKGISVDEISDKKLVDILNKTNYYGRDYAKQLRNNVNNSKKISKHLYPKFGEVNTYNENLIKYPYKLPDRTPYRRSPIPFLDKLRYAIKYLPAVGGVGITSAIDE